MFIQTKQEKEELKNMKKHIKETLKKAAYVQVNCYLTEGEKGFGIIDKFPEVMVILSSKSKNGSIIPVDKTNILGVTRQYSPADYHLNFSEAAEGKSYICVVRSIKGRKVYVEPLLESKESFNKEIHDFDQDEADFISNEFGIDKELIKLYSKAFNIKIHATMQAVFIQTNCNHWMLQLLNNRPALFHENRTRYGINGSGTNGSYHKQYVCEAESINDYLQYIIMHDFSYKPKNNLKKYCQTKQMYA